MQTLNKPQEPIGIVKDGVILKDGWEPIVQCGTIYWAFFDDGDLVTTVPRHYRDKILEKSGLSLKLIENGEENCIKQVKFFE